MIIDTSQGNIEVVGDIKEFKTSIDPKNLEFITTLLSSNLYSDPEQSFIREIVSNAWDSHVEAGTTDIPVIVRFKNHYEGGSVTIRDFGTGLSPKRFQEVYCNIGSSTKRESNEFIGGFGIGKYSSLACSNTVYITSYYEGVAYYYVMVKSGNSITTNLLVEKPTTEKNGVEVTIKNIRDLNPYDKALQYITFFPNIYIDGASCASRINEAKLKKFTNFAAASIPITSKLLLGNVLYPLQTYHLANDVRGYVSMLERTGIVIKFDVGELNITPNRENIIYSSDTIKKIENRVRAAKLELDALVNKKISQDYTNIFKYYDAITKVVYYDPVTDSIIPFGGYRVEPTSITNATITYKGLDLIEEKNALDILTKVELPNFKGLVYNNTIYAKKVPYNMRAYNRVESPKLLVLNAKARLTAPAKAFLRSYYNEFSVISYINSVKFSDYIKEKCGILLKNSSKREDFIISELYKSMMENSVSLDLDNSPVYIKYKTDITTSSPTELKDVREFILYIWNHRGYKEKKHFKRFSHAIEFIRGLKKGVILSNMDADDSLMGTLANLKGFVYIKARKDIISDLKSLNLSCVVDINWLIKEDPMLSITRTIIDYFPSGINIRSINEINETLDEQTQKEFCRLCKIASEFGSSAVYRGLAMNEKISQDSYTKYLCIKLKKYLDKYEVAKNLVKTLGYYSPVLVVAVIIKTKAYRVSGKAYNEVKNNKLLNVLCKK